MKIVDAATVSRVLDMSRLIDAFEVAHRRPRMDVLDAFMGGEGAQYVIRSAVDPGRYMASKMFTSFPGNLAEGRLPAVQAVCVLFDGRDSRPLAMIDGTTVTHWRTAADSGLAARLLAHPAPRTLLCVGAGQMAPWLVKAHRTVRPSLARVLVWNRSRPRAEHFVATLRQDGVAAEIVDDLAAGVREADVITSCTRSHQPLIKGAHLKPGVHLDLVGGYTPETREADDDAARSCRIFVDRRESAFHGVGDILAPIANGTITQADVLGDLYDLAAGRVEGRLKADDRTFFKNAGGGHLDLMTCEAVLAEVDRAGL